MTADVPFPPADGWCLEVVDHSGTIVRRDVFLLAEDAREAAKTYAWQHKDHQATVFERRAGDTVFRTVIAYPR